MKTNTIITIGREFGSAGREIGYKVAKEFGIKLYDKEMLARAAKESGICEEIFESHDEKPTSSFLYSLVMDTYSIKKIADEGPCILVGRCADYALESYKNVVSVFIHADLDARIRRIARIYNLTDAKAKDMILKTDKKRAGYYNYYTNKKWSDSKSYELCLTSSELGIDGTANAIIDYVKLKESIAKESKRI